jgi:hypothetical protein
MADLDQGGISRQWTNTALGPSVGWTRGAARSVFNITAAGVYSIDLSITDVFVNVAGTVVVNLPSAKNPPAPAITVPGGYVKPNVRILDVGGHATGNPITINAVAGETINGINTQNISTNFGSLILEPTSEGLGWIEM